MMYQLITNIINPLITIRLNVLWFKTLIAIITNRETAKVKRYYKSSAISIQLIIALRGNKMEFLTLGWIKRNRLRYQSLIAKKTDY